MLLKIDEVVVIAKNVSGEDVSKQLEANAASIKARSESSITNDPKVQERLTTINEALATRKAAFPERLTEQKAKYNLPLFPTTTIGSSHKPKTSESTETNLLKVKLLLKNTKLLSTKKLKLLLDSKKKLVWMF